MHNPGQEQAIKDAAARFRARRAAEGRATGLISDWSKGIMDRAIDDVIAGITAKLGLNDAQINAMYTAGPVDGFTGAQVVAELRQRFDVADDEDWIDTLEARGVLTTEEAVWLRDAD